MNQSVSCAQPVLMMWMMSGWRRLRPYKYLPLWITYTFQQRYARTNLGASLWIQHNSICWIIKTTMAVIRNEVFSCFVFYGVLLVIKMYVIAIVTGQVRLRKKVSDSCRCIPTLTQTSDFNFNWSKMFYFFLNPERLLPTPKTRWDTEVCSTTERIHTWKDAGGESAESLIYWKSQCHDMLWLYLTCIWSELHRTVGLVLTKI